MPKLMRNGHISVCQLRRNGNLPRAADSRANHSFGEMSSGLKESGWRTRTRVIFPTRTQGLTVSLAWHLWSNMHPTDMDCTTWLGMFGSGPRTGIDRTITHGLLSPAA